MRYGARQIQEQDALFAQRQQAIAGAQEVTKELQSHVSLSWRHQQHLLQAASPEVIFQPQESHVPRFEPVPARISDAQKQALIEVLKNSVIKHVIP